MSGHPFDPALPSFAGDFYPDHEEVTRGATIASVPFPPQGGFGVGDFFHEAPGDASKSWPLPDPSGFVSPSPLPMVAQDPAERFQESDQASAMPNDTFFELEATTLFVHGAPSHEVGNAVLDFLLCDAEATVTKLSRRKCAVKASVLSQLGLVDLKVRIWRQEGEDLRLATEFQRKGGDTIAFAQVYGKASDYLKDRLPVASANVPESSLREQWDLPVHVPEAHSVDGCSGVELVEPVFALASRADSPQLQEQAAAALLRALESGSLCATEALSANGVAALHELMQVACSTVANLVARLLLALSSSPGACEHTALPGLLAMALRNVRFGDPAMRLQQSHRIAQAVRVFVAGSAGLLPRAASDELASALTLALEGAPSKAGAQCSGGDAVELELQQALTHLHLARPH